MEKEQFIVEAIAKANGTIFSVTFVKMDGSLRKMSCRRGVVNPSNAQKPKGIVDRKEEDRKSGTITVYDCNADRTSNKNKGGYRRFRIDSVVYLKVRGQAYNFSERTNNE